MTKYLLFSVGGYIAGIEIEKVIHIEDIEKIKERYENRLLIGLITSQEEIYPIVDIRSKLSKDFKVDKNNKVIVCIVNENKKIGFVVDKVSQMITIDKKDEISKELINKKEVKFMVHSDESIYPILNLGFFLSKKDINGLDDVVSDYKKKTIDEKNKTVVVENKEDREKRIEKIWKTKHLTKN